MNTYPAVQYPYDSEPLKLRHVLAAVVVGATMGVVQYLKSVLRRRV